MKTIEKKIPCRSPQLTSKSLVGAPLFLLHYFALFSFFLAYLLMLAQNATCERVFMGTWYIAVF